MRQVVLEPITGIKNQNQHHQIKVNSQQSQKYVLDPNKAEQI